MIVVPSGSATIHPAWFTSTYSPPFFFGFHPDATSDYAALGVRAQTVFATMLTPDDHIGAYQSAAGDWNVTMVKYTGPDSSQHHQAFVSIGYTLDSYGTARPMWSDKILTATTATCQAGGQTTSNNNGIDTTVSLIRGHLYNFSVSLNASETGITYKIKDLGGGGTVWSYFNSTGNGAAYTAGFPTNGASLIPCPVSGVSSGFYGTNLGEQVGKTLIEPAPGYSLYFLALGMVKFNGNPPGLKYMDNVLDIAFSTNGSPNGVITYAVGTGGSPYYSTDRLQNERFATYFGVPTDLIGSIQTIDYQTVSNTSTVGGFVLQETPTATHLNVSIVGVYWIGSGLTSAFCGSGCGYSLSNYSWVIDIQTSSTSGSTAYLYVIAANAANTMQTETVIFIQVT